MHAALDPSTPLVQNERLRGWIQLGDEVLFRQAALVLGVEELKALAAEYVDAKMHFEAAKVMLAQARTGSARPEVVEPLMEDAYRLLGEGERVETREGQQLSLDVLKVLQVTSSYTQGDGDEKNKIMLRRSAAAAKLLENKALRRDPLEGAMALIPKSTHGPLRD